MKQALIKGTLDQDHAMQMIKLPSSIVVHQQMDTLDTKLAAQASEFTTNPLEDTLGIFDFRKYQQIKNQDYAYTKVDKLWQINVKAEEEENADYSNLDTEETGEVAKRRIQPRQTRKDSNTLQVKINNIKTEMQLKQELFRTISASHDKLCFIR